MKTLVKGQLKLKQNQKILTESIPEDELTIHAFKFLIDNKLITIQSFALGLEAGKIKDYASFCWYYDIRIYKKEDEEEPVVAEPHPSGNVQAKAQAPKARGAPPKIEESKFQEAVNSVDAQAQFTHLTILAHTNMTFLKILHVFHKNKLFDMAKITSLDNQITSLSKQQLLQVKGLDLLPFEKEHLKAAAAKDPQRYPRSLEEMTSFNIWIHLIRNGFVRPSDPSQYLKQEERTAGAKYAWDTEKMTEYIAAKRDDAVTRLTANQKRGQDELGKLGVQQFRALPENRQHGTVQANYDLSGSGKNSIYLINEIFDDQDLHQRLKDSEYKAESIFHEFKNLERVDQAIHNKSIPS